ncbi:MAG: hypothetical protein WBH04_10965 [Albidovulum sp.]
MQTIEMEMLRDVLLAERECLKSGDFGALDALATRKQQATERLARGAGDRAVLRRLLAAAQENQRYIEAALKGVRSAQARLRAIHSAAAGMTSYTAQGQMLRLSQENPKVERRS